MIQSEKMQGPTRRRACEDTATSCRRCRKGGHGDGLGVTSQSQQPVRAIAFRRLGHAHDQAGGNHRACPGLVVELCKFPGHTNHLSLLLSATPCAAMQVQAPLSLLAGSRSSPPDVPCNEGVLRAPDLDLNRTPRLIKRVRPVGLKRGQFHVCGSNQIDTKRWILVVFKIIRTVEGALIYLENHLHVILTLFLIFIVDVDESGMNEIIWRLSFVMVTKKRTMIFKYYWL
jgi:hypothetical protein